MKIAFDFDGVILNSEVSVKYYADYFSYFCCNGKVRNKNNDVAQENCFDWTKDEEKEFFEKYFDMASNDCDLIVGAKQILTKLKQDGHELYVVSLRGYYREKELEVGEKTIKKLGVDFDGVFWKTKDKISKCKELGIDVLIDNDPKYVKELKNSNIKVLYFRDGFIENVVGKNTTTVETWVDVYRQIKEMKKD